MSRSWAASPPPCSRSARPQKALAGRAQLGPGQPPMGSLEIFGRDEVKR